jgi:hypothetical protein
VELACAYSRDRLIFLGVSIAEKRFYIPHSVYSEKGEVPFEEPLWWRITESAQVQGMMEDMEAMIRAEMSKAAYLQKWIPSNPAFDPKDSQQVRDAILDFEGWIFMKKAVREVEDKDHLLVMASTDFPSMIYSKVKTEAYYLSHKFKPRKIPELIELSKTAGDIFPLTTRVAAFLGGDSLLDALVQAQDDILTSFDFSPESELMMAAQQAFEKRLAAAEALKREGGNVKIPKDPLKGFERRPDNVKWRIILNFAGLDMVGERLVVIFVRAFPLMDVEGLGSDPGGTLKDLLMSLEMWKREGFRERAGLENLLALSSVQPLVKACIGHTVK